MLAKVFPRQIDNNYRGHWLGLWIFGLVVLFKGAIGAGTMFNGRRAAVGADGIPLDSFTPAGADAFVALFAAWGLSQLVLNLIGVLALIRYRAMVPLMFTVLFVEHAARRVVFSFLPIERTEAPPGLWINLALGAVLVIGLLLSLWERREERAAV